MDIRADLASLVEAELHNHWYERHSAALLKIYDERREAARRQNTRFMTWVGVFIYCCFPGLYFILIPDIALPMTMTCTALAIGVAILIESLVRTRACADIIDSFSATLLVTMYIACLYFIGNSSNLLGVSYLLVFGTLFMMVGSILFDYRPAVSMMASTAVLVAFLCMVSFINPMPLLYNVAFGAFHICCMVFAMIVNGKLNVERYSVFLNAFQAEMRQAEVADQGRELLRLSNTDALTGIENRRSIDEKLSQLWGTRVNSGADFAVVLLDIDFFKRFNDGYGHQEGDRCLVLVAQALAAVAVAFNGFVGRYGGEEFIMIAPVGTQAQVIVLAEAIRSAVEDLNLAHEHRRDGMSIVTVSLGATITRSNFGANVETIVKEADLALYAAKAGGRNCARLFDPNDPQSGDESENIAAILKIAIAQDLVSLVYQPIQGISSNQVEAVEALMRLRMFDGAFVPPNVFIPIAERTGDILSLGRWAIRTVCRDLLADGRIPIASVNVSVVQLKMPGFSASVAAILGETGVTGNRLALEITEGLDIEANSDVLRCINDLKQLGIKIWLDDFGTGFAGLSWLRLIEFDTVKIDRSFLHNYVDPKGLAMLQDIIGFIRNRGHRILVEGVETEEQLALMRDCSIDQVQGYHVGRPASAENYRTPLILPAARSVL